VTLPPRLAFARWPELAARGVTRVRASATVVLAGRRGATVLRTRPLTTDDLATIATYALTGVWL
jgi:hypothetical protein